MVSVCINKKIALAFTGLFVEVWCINACATGLFKTAFASAVVTVENEVVLLFIAIGIGSGWVRFSSYDKPVALALAVLLICEVRRGRGLG